MSPLTIKSYEKRFNPQVKAGTSVRDEALYNVKAAIAYFIGKHASEGRDLLEIGGFNGWHTIAYRDQLKNPRRTVIYDWQDFRFDSVKSECEFARVDLEQDRFPDANLSFDVVVCNQVFEHLKNVARPLSEILRVLRVGGCLVFSVPNNCALHNCLLFLLGKQPTATRIMGSHVRGFNIWATSEFLELGGHFQVQEIKGFGMLPFTSAALPGVLKTWCHTPVWCLLRKESSAIDWGQTLQKSFISTNF